MQTELLEWKTIPDTCELYEINTNGVVRSRLTSDILPQSMNGRARDYAGVSLAVKGKSTRYAIHRLLAQLWIPNPENKPCVDHIDQNPLNNSIENLRWVTYKENRENSKNCVYVEWEGERILLLHLAEKLFGHEDLKSNYISLLNIYKRGNTIEETVEMRKSYLNNENLHHSQVRALKRREQGIFPRKNNRKRKLKELNINPPVTTED